MPDPLVSLVRVMDTPNGPVDLDSIDGDELIIRTVDGALTFSNGVGSLFGGPIWHSLADLGRPVLNGVEQPTRLEVRVLNNPDAR